MCNHQKLEGVGKPNISENHRFGRYPESTLFISYRNVYQSLVVMYHPCLDSIRPEQERTEPILRHLAKDLKQSQNVL